MHLSIYTNTNRKNMFLCLPGHSVLQVLFCTDMPSQKAPPLRGAGFVHVRERFCTPRPHRTLQGDQSVHDDQPPFTVPKDEKKEMNRCCDVGIKMAYVQVHIFCHETQQ